MSGIQQLAFAVAASVGLYTTALALPTAAPLLIVFVPLPGMILATPRSSAVTGLWAVLTAAIVSVGLGPAAGLGFLLPMGTCALVVVLCVERRVSIERTVITGVASWSLGLLALLLITYGSPWLLVDGVHEQLVRAFDLAFPSSAAGDTAGSALATLGSEREAVIAALLSVMPAFLVLTGAVVVLVNVGLWHRWGHAFGDVDLRAWRLPDAMIWAVLGTGFSMLALSGVAGVVTRNAFIVLLGCYFCQGLSIVSYYLDRFGLPRGVRIATYFIIAIQQAVSLVVVALGLFDLWADFRRLRTESLKLELPSDGK